MSSAFSCTLVVTAIGFAVLLAFLFGRWQEQDAQDAEVRQAQADRGGHVRVVPPVLGETATKWGWTDTADMGDRAPFRVTDPPPPPVPHVHAASASATVDESVWSRLAQCESTGNPRAVSASGKYRGLYQFSIETWLSVGETGDPIDASPEVQLAAAKRLQARSGWSQWPQCAARLGLPR